MPTATLSRKPRARKTAPPADPVIRTAPLRFAGLDVRPSTLDERMTRFVHDAVVIAAELGMPWNDTSRLVGHVRVSVGTLLPYKPGIVRKLYEAADRADFGCFGEYGSGTADIDHRELGLNLLRQFAGRPPGRDYSLSADRLVDALHAMVRAA